ncbi:hypothetical protein SORBI_3010G191200 [Sorghum bicolor]|uniref:Uncharacterized protein n=1 Tax=Sorghum bicolor TaxID=4558 RepID=A0A194YK76_SORBI|nr:hypothetical protein SORBI_3010G191200 [Sorghum bicolor]
MAGSGSTLLPEHVAAALLRGIATGGRPTLVRGLQRTRRRRCGAAQRRPAGHVAAGGGRMRGRHAELRRGIAGGGGCRQREEGQAKDARWRCDTPARAATAEETDVV